MRGDLVIKALKPLTITQKSPQFWSILRLLVSGNLKKIIKHFKTCADTFSHRGSGYKILHKILFLKKKLVKETKNCTVAFPYDLVNIYCSSDIHKYNVGELLFSSFALTLAVGRRRNCPAGERRMMLCSCSQI